MKKKGFMIIEILVCILIITIVVITSVAFVTYISRETKNAKDKAIAILKANQIISEIRNYVDSNKERTNLRYLDNFNDSTPNPLLTIENIIDPTLAPSENIRLGNNYKYARQILVYPIPNSPNSANIRIVEVRMFKWNRNRWEYLTSVTTVVNTLADFSSPKQVYDIFFLSIGTVPGWWVHTPEIRQVVDSVISDLESRNPSLDINPRWISVMCYGGRDPYYRPFIGVRNQDSRGDPLDSDFVYYYPGTSYINNNRALGFRYYTDFLMMGNIWYSDESNSNIRKNVYPFSIADQYNHCCRYPEEIENYNKIVEYSKQRGLPIPEISYRMLIEKLYSDVSFRNAIIINLHGELMPIPPLRNDSDPAKLPLIDTTVYTRLPSSFPTNRYQNIRVAVHPENIAYRDTGIPNQEDISLRVYAYQLNPDVNILPNHRIEYITLLIGPMQNSNYTITVRGIDGGVNPLSSSYIDLINNQTVNVTTSETIIDPQPGSNTMKANMKIVSIDGKNYISIKLRNTPTKCPLVVGAQGLPPSKRLYGMEYIPFMFPFHSNGNNRNLLWQDANAPKNTARWIITIHNVERTANINSPLKIYYTIDPPTSTDGKSHIYDLNMWDRLPDYTGKTYVWVCRNLDEIPITEQFQILGDPRLCPYKDVVENMRYNAYFSFPNNTNIDSIKSEYFNNSGAFLSDSYDGIPANIPGAFFIVREALARSNSIFNSITGFSFYYVGFGQEVGGDSANNLPNGVPVSNKVFGGTGVIDGEQSIITENGNGNAGFGIKNIIRTSVNWGGSNPVAWGNFALPFLGEIFPDDMYTQWKQNGNLPNSQFVKRRWRDSISTNFPNYRLVRTGVRGCSSFFNAQPSNNNNKWFNHGWGDYTTLAATKQATSDLETAFNITLPQQITAARPWDIGLDFQGQPLEWNNPFYVNNRFINSVYERYYDHRGANGATISSGIVRSYKRNNPNRLYYWAVINGLSPQGSEAQSFVARYSITSSIYAFLLAGFDTNANITTPPPQIPIIRIIEPENTQEITTSTVRIRYEIDFKRWDNRNYIINQPGTITQNPHNWRYLIKYQPLGDSNWYFIQDTSRQFPTKLGEKPENNANYINTTSYDWNLSNIPNGMYWLVVEAHHIQRIHHYSYHMVFIRINK